MGAFDQVIPGQLVPTCCPKCGHQRTQSLAWIRSNPRMICLSCGTKMATAPFNTASRASGGGVKDLSKKLSKEISLRTKGG